MESIPYLQNNVAFNPLFIKMKERFCADGDTIAQKMAKEAGLCKKKSKRSSMRECQMKQGNFLPQKSEKGSKLKKKVLSLKGLSAFSVSFLIIGTLFLSGAAFDNVQQIFTPSEVTATVSTEEEHIVSESTIDTAHSLYCTESDDLTTL